MEEDKSVTEKKILKNVNLLLFSEKGEPLPVNSEINDELPSAEVSKSWLFSAIPKRYIIIILVALANFNMYCIRMCVNVTIVAMTHSEVKQNASTGSHLATESVSFGIISNYILPEQVLKLV